MSLYAKTEVIFGIKCVIDLSDDDMDILDKNGICVSPCVYRFDEKTKSFIIGVKICQLSNVGESKEIKFHNINEKDFKEKIIKALDSIEIDVSENKNFTTYINSYYY